MKSFLKQFFLFFTPVILLSVMAFGLLDYLLTKNDQGTMFVSQHTKITLAQELIEREFRIITSDLHYLVRSCAVTAYLDSSRKDSLQILENVFENFNSSKMLYDQIRFLDETGLELVRANFNGGQSQLVSREQLQDKSKRYYFLDSIKLNRDEVFVSPFDLNIEYGEIERPLKPMIRFGSPVFDSMGNKRGVVLLNYLGEVMLSRIKEMLGTDRLHSGSDNVDHIMLINKDGYFLISDRHDDEWGFMFNKESIFAKRFAGEWKVLSAKDSGRFITKNGLFTFVTIYPLITGQKSSSGSPQPFTSSAKDTTDHEYYWKLIAWVDSEQLDVIENKHQRLIIIFFGISSFIVLIGCWLIARTRLQRRQAMILNEKNEEKFRTVADYSYAWETWISPEGSILYISPSCERISGYTKAEFEADPYLLDKIIHPDDRGITGGHFQRSTLEESVCNLDFRIITKNGETRWIGHTCQAVFDQNGQFVGRRGSNHDITLRVNAKEQLKQMALHDNLTGLANRNLLFDRLQHLVAAYSRSKKKFAVLFVDLDCFKNINDSMGHEAGDVALQEVAWRLRQTIRGADTVARFGGDEFVVVLEDIDSPAEIDAVAEKIIRSIREPVLLATGVGQLGASIGCSIFPANGNTPEILVHVADQAMYLAKNNGKNCFHFAGK